MRSRSSRRANAPVELTLLESGGDNLTAIFSRALVDRQIFVIDVAGGDKVPRKGGPGVTTADLLVINKTDLAATGRRRPGGDGPRRQGAARRPADRVHLAGRTRRRRRRGRLGARRSWPRWHSRRRVDRLIMAASTEIVSGLDASWRTSARQLYVRGAAAGPRRRRPTGPRPVLLLVTVPPAHWAATVSSSTDGGEGAAVTVRSVGATMVHPGAAGDGSTLEIDVSVGAGATLDWWPEPTVSVRGSDHRTVDAARDRCPTRRVTVGGGVSSVGTRSRRAGWRCSSGSRLVARCRARPRDRFGDATFAGPGARERGDRCRRDVGGIVAPAHLDVARRGAAAFCRGVFPICASSPAVDLRTIDALDLLWPEPSCRSTQLLV